MQTHRFLDYPYNIKTKIDADVFPEPVVTWGYGDGTVPVYSSLLPGLKWAYEFDTQSAKEAKPVKIIDICSVYNLKDSPYDIRQKDKSYKFSKNEFIGMNCECMLDPTPEECNHSTIIRDALFVDFVQRTLIGNERSKPYTKFTFIDELDDEYLDVVTTTCPQVVF